ncbi:hypothetical protein PVK06_012527 [Gossypium arboreum]|uniref:Uncharacterized protein n=1 Tax=Gossypium arboreum TaxID=29729 RepID=A0ABR0QBQ7_GOSAR|nr:hypothetical protein PVK06_012527 [Gossypium arboreum]
MSNIHNSDHENPYTIDDHDKIQLKLVTKDYVDEFDLVEIVSDPIDIVAELTINVEVKDELNTNMEPKSIVNESVEEPIHFLTIAKKVPTDDIEPKPYAIDLDVNTTNPDRFEAIIPRKKLRLARI